MNRSTRNTPGDLRPLGLAAALVALVFPVMGPLQLYLSNIGEFWFPLTALLGPCLLTGLGAALALLLLGAALRGSARSVYLCLLMGLGLALYLQGNLVSTDYGVLNGQAIDWASYGLTALWNTALWATCLVLPFLVRWLAKGWRKLFAYAALGLILVQLLTLGALCLTTDLTGYQRGGSYLSDRNLFHAAEDQGVVTFILDTFDQAYLEEIMAEDPDFLAPLEGFTGFTNAASAYPTTKGSLPYLLTGRLYRNEQPYGDYVDAAWQEDGYYEALRQAGFRINLYTANGFVSDAAREAYCDNSGEGELSVSSRTALEKAFLRFAGFRYLPHLAKKYVWFYSGIFDELRAAEGAAVYTEDNLAFYDRLRREGLSPQSGRLYQLIHLNGAHGPYTLAADATPSTSATELTQAKASLTIVYEYLAQLRALGLYDRTMVVITADHGLNDFAPILLVKPFDGAGDLRFTDAPVSHGNLRATVMAALGLNEQGTYGASLFEAGAEPRQAYFYTWDDDWDAAYLPPMRQMQALPEGNALENFLWTGWTYSESGATHEPPYAYELGTPLRFRTGTAENLAYFLSGAAAVAEVDNAVWSLGKRGRLALDVGASADLTVSITFSGTYAKAQPLTVRCGEVTLYQGRISGEHLRAVFDVPAECLPEGLLLLDVEYPEAWSPLSRGESDDPRELAVLWQELLVTTAE